MALVDLLAQVAATAVLEKGGKTRHVEPHQPGALLGCGSPIAGRDCRRRQLGADAFGQALHLGWLAEPQAPGVGGVEHPIAEAGGELRQLLAGGVVSGLRLSLQGDAAKLHVPQLGRQDAPLGGVEIIAFAEPPQGCVDHLALARPVAEGHHSPLLAGVRLPQFETVADAREMAHHAPAPAQAFAQAVERIHHRGPVQGMAAGERRSKMPLDRAEIGLELGHQLGDVFIDMLRLDRLEGGQSLPVQKRRRERGGGSHRRQRGMGPFQPIGASDGGARRGARATPGSPTELPQAAPLARARVWAPTWASSVARALVLAS